MGFQRQLRFYHKVAAASAFTLLNKKTLSQKFKIGEMVYIPGRLLKKHPNSLRDALGKIKEVLGSGKDYTVQMVDGTILRRHYSSLVSATANANQADVKLIDPFQLVDFKTKILPDHLYPKFRLQLDKFKDQNPNIDITDDTENDSIQSQHKQGPTGDQRVEKALTSNDKNDTDDIIRHMISKVRKEPIQFPPNLTEIKRPKSFNKRKDPKRDKISTPRYNQPLAIEHVEDSTEINIDPPVENQHSSERIIQTNDSPTDSIELDTNDQQVYNEPLPVHPERLQEGVESAEPQSTKSKKDTSQAIEGQLRRSSRITKLSAKALQLATLDSNKS